MSTGPSSMPDSSIHVVPVISPLPLSVNHPANTVSPRRCPRGRIAVTPVRTGPLPTTRFPLPLMSVTSPTSTPATSVIALYLPGVPSKGTPRSRARGWDWARAAGASTARKTQCAKRRSMGDPVRDVTEATARSMRRQLRGSDLPQRVVHRPEQRPHLARGVIPHVPDAHGARHERAIPRPNFEPALAEEMRESRRVTSDREARHRRRAQALAREDPDARPLGATRPTLAHPPLHQLGHRQMPGIALRQPLARDLRQLRIQRVELRDRRRPGGLALPPVPVS